MEYRYLGKSGVQVSVVSFGSWVTFGYQIADSVAEKLMGIAYDSGINFFDNAEVYANGQSEKVMGKILKKMNWDRTSYLLSSKVFFGDGRRKPNQTGLSRKHIFEACEDALRRLQTDYLDLYFCHRPDKNTPMAEVVWAMNHLMQQGKILYWGTSEWSTQEIMEAHLVAKEYRLIGPVMEQPEYNMFQRQKVEVDYELIYKNQGLGTTIWSPLASGILTKKYAGNIPSDTRLSLKGYEWLRDKVLLESRLKKVKKLNELAEAIGTTLPKMAIAWVIKNPNVSTAILGASKVTHLKENLDALNVVSLISPEINEKIEHILKNKPQKPLY